MATPRTPVTATDIGALADITDVTLDRGGQRFAAVISVPDIDINRYRREVIIGAIEGAGTEPVDAGAPGATRMPRWSPTGRHLAVVVDTENGCGITVVDPQTMQRRSILDGWPDPIEELSWSPDGATVLFVVREPVHRDYWELPDDRRPPMRLTRLRYREDGIGWLAGRPRQAYLLDLAPDGGSDIPGTSGSPRKLSVGGFDDAQFSWHPDGQSVFFVSQRQAGRDRTTLNDIFCQPLAGQARQLTATSHEFGTPRPSPDGAIIACTMLDIIGYPAATHLAMLDASSGVLTDLTADLDRDCHGESAVWGDAHSIYAIVEAEGRSDVRRFDVAAPGAQGRVIAGDRRITAFDLRAGRLVAVCSSAAEPPMLVAETFTAGNPGAHPESAARGAVLADPNEQLRRCRILGSPVRTVVQVAPGVAVDSWLVRPDSASWTAPHPVILWLQGGGTQYGYQFSHELQMLVSAGFAVLYCNPRGSAGYGSAWMRTVSGQRAARPGSGWGGSDIADAAAVLRRTLADNADLDAGRVGVMGGSYGGLVTTQLLAQTDLFAAGWAERGPYNLFSDAGTKDEAPWFFDAYLGSSHLDDADSYWQASPIRRAADITAPLMIVHSEQDYRCTIGQAEELFMALKLLDRDVELVRFPGECHNLTRAGHPIHRLQRLELLLEWFGGRLSPNPASPTR